MGPYEIVFEDSSLLIVNKAQGLATTPGKLQNLCDIIFADFPSLLKVKGYKKNEGGLLNRLDNDTGGLVLFAKTDSAFTYYSQQMKNKLVEKTYTAIVSGVPQTDKGCIQYPVAHHYKNKKKMIVITRGKKIQYKGKPQPAETCWKLIKKNSSLACLQIRIYQGKRHQIRVHLAAIGHPIIGDKLYYSGPIESPYHLLYASQIKFKDMQNRPQVISVEVPFLKQYFID